MKTIKTLIEENSVSNRCTVNNDLYNKLIIALSSDDEYVAEEIKSFDAKGEPVTEGRHLSTEWQRFVATIIKKTSAVTEAEALEAAGKFELSADQAKTLASLVHEADYISVAKCKKKVPIFNKKDLNVDIFTGMCKESTRQNPQNRDLSVKIDAHQVLKMSQKLAPSMKKIVKTK